MFGYDFDATAAPLVRWGIEYGDGRSYTADTEAQARTQVFWHWYRSPGTFTVTAWVEDATGRRASDSCQFTWTQPPPPPPPRPATEGPVAGETASQENARESAARYLDLTSFSRSGLIEQLEFEGFTQAQAEYGVDALDVDWGEQAAKSAARYLDLTSFSRSGLIAQLEFEGFTQAQAEYGVGTTGL